MGSLFTINEENIKNSRLLGLIPTTFADKALLKRFDGTICLANRAVESSCRERHMH